MKQYVIPFLVYVSLIPILTFLLRDNQVAYTINVFVMLALIAFFWKDYKLKFKFDVIAIAAGIIIITLWIVLENFYAPMYTIEYMPRNTFLLIMKLAGFILVAPVIEELFVRGFLMRYIIDKDWEKIQIGKYTFASFAITSLFFGLAHNRWLVGILAGIMFNLLLYKQKRIESCIIAHYTANLILAIYILATGSWQFW